MSDDVAALLEEITRVHLLDFNLQDFLERLCATSLSPQEVKLLYANLMRLGAESLEMAHLGWEGSPPLVTLQHRMHERVHAFYRELAHWLLFWEVTQTLPPSTALLEAIRAELHEIILEMLALHTL